MALTHLIFKKNSGFLALPGRVAKTGVVADLAIEHFVAQLAIPDGAGQPSCRLHPREAGGGFLIGFGW